MFNIFKSDPLKKLTKEYANLMEKAMLAQRNGDIALSGKLNYQAQELWNKIEELKKKNQEDQA